MLAAIVLILRRSFVTFAISEDTWPWHALTRPYILVVARALEVALAEVAMIAIVTLLLEAVMAMAPRIVAPTFLNLLQGIRVTHRVAMVVVLLRLSLARVCTLMPRRLSTTPTLTITSPQQLNNNSSTAHIILNSNRLMTPIDDKS